MTGINHKLTKQQEEIVKYQGDEILVRGIADSGKTLVMLRKAKLTAEKYPDQQIAVFTYGKTLTNASSLLMEEQNLKNLHIRTFHSWAMSAYYKVMKKSCYMIKKSDEDFLGNAIKKLAKTNDHRFVLEETKYKEFLKDEISWIKGKGIDSLVEYLGASRRGRGSEIRVTEKDRRMIFEICEGYNKEKGYRMDYDDIGLELSKKLNQIPEEVKFDHIFIDEGQDLQQVQLHILRTIARKSFFIAADKGQKIYKTSFAWKDIGLNITGGRTKILKESFRSTKEIIQLAASLQKNDSVVNDDEYTPLELPTSSGPVPAVIQCSTREEQFVAVGKTVKQLREGSPEATIGILARHGWRFNALRPVLREFNIVSEIVNQKDGNPYSPGVKLCKMHSSKGLEFDYVIVIDLIEPELSEEMDTDEFWEVERRLLYVSITRATTYLQLYYYGEGSRLINELDRSLYKKVTV
ncbi:UvrD-helicase domain-containing protein [Neobacillus sp. CF12]|uniref:UvrD-helicase domain-containing protein n=1 Tax=Neobacillus sp. CF12 TaxID=3055864 RepID=UPI0025A0439A|nr:UvrD-helicase domain-containing protein [Neobacillus sp. CF12]MDM5326792.1 3'-5' exonuclease [Neobacillus sp. CF12]